MEARDDLPKLVEDHDRLKRLETIATQEEDKRRFKRRYLFYALVIATIVAKTGATLH